VYPEFRLVVGTTRVAVSVHGLAILLGVGAGAALAAQRARARAPVLLAVAVISAVALVASHGLFRGLHGGGGGFWSGGLASSGGIVAGLLTAWVIARPLGCAPADLLDAIVPAGLLALGIGRVGCFLAGCCYGRPTTLPWGVVFPDLGPPPRHPLQLYSAAADVALVALLPARAAVPGAVARRGCVGFALVRAVLECLRDHGATGLLPGGWITLPHALAVVLMTGVALLPRLRPQGPSTMPPARRTPAHGR